MAIAVVGDPGPARARLLPACSADCVSDVFGVTVSTGRGSRLLENRGVRGWSLLDLSGRGRLVFTRGTKLATAAIDGTDVRPVAEGNVGRARLSPNGLEIVYTVFAERKDCGSGSELWVVDTTGSDPRKLSDCANYPAWAPDSRRVVFLGNYDGANTGTVSIAGIDGRARRDLRVWHGTSAPEFAWSARGRIAYTEGSGLGVVTIVRASGTGPPITLRRAFAPAWAPDGRRLSFVKIERAPRRMSLRTLDPTDGGQRVIDIGEGIANPSWSGTGLAYVKASDPGKPGGIQIYVKEPGKAPRRLTALPGNSSISRPIWSSDGKRIVYASCRT